MDTTRSGGLRGSLALALGLLFLFAPQSVQAQARTVDPRAYGFDLPPGSVQTGKGQRVATRDRQGQGVVALLHAQVGKHRIVMLPDGSLESRPQAESPLTERPFEPCSKDELAARLIKKLPGFRARQTRRYLYVFNTTDGFALATSRILESMFPGVEAYVESQKIPVQRPRVPLVAIMFRTQREFQAYKKVPDGVVAYYDPLSNHIVMYEESTRPAVKPELALQQAISTIAHEGAHQILHNIGVQQRLSRWPMWISEGLAEYFAPTTTGKRLKWKGAGQVNDLRMFELEQYVQSRAADKPNGEMVDHTVTAARLTSTGYATAWALTHYLAKQHRLDFHKYVRDVSRTEPFQGAPARGTSAVQNNLVLFQKHFGDDLTEIERRLILHLKKLPYRDPFAEWPHYVGLAVYGEGRRPVREARLFHTPTLAEKWRRELPRRVTDEQRRTLRSEIRQFPNRPLAEQFTRQWLRGS